LGQNEGYQGSDGGGGKTKLDNTPPMDERSQGWFMIADRVNTLISSYSSRYFGEGRTGNYIYISYIYIETKSTTY
jgi:hypothetical protein